MIDQKGRLFGKVSIIDIIIVLAVVVAVVWFFRMKTAGANQTGPADQVLVVSYMVEEAPEFVANIINVGDKLLDWTLGTDLGVVTSIELSDGYEIQPDQYGVQQKAFKEGYKRIDMTTEVKGRPSGNGYAVNGSQLYIGQYITLTSGKGVVFIMVSGVEMKGSD